MTTTDFDYVRFLVRNEAAIALEPGREYLVEARLQTLAHKEKLPSVDELVCQLRAQPGSELQRRVVEAMTTGETSFFRDVAAFETFRKSVLPELVRLRREERRLNFWCGAASTGQEPFSILMTLAESFPDLLRWNLTFLATDLCRDALARAKAGRFSQLEVNRGLPATLLMKYFTRQYAEWEFRQDLRRRVEFREQNLVGAWPEMPPVDVIFLRNVLCYFDADVKKSVLAKVRQALRPDGYLLLGGTETASLAEEGFAPIGAGPTSWFRIAQD